MRAAAAEVTLTTDDLRVIDAALAGAVPVRGPNPEGM
jgi:hypothetical protein